MARTVSRLLAATVLAVTLTACGDGSSGTVSEADPRAETSASTQALAAAAETLEAFFQVKGRANEPLSAKIDRQERYLTERSVHPTAAYEDGMGEGPAGITEEDVLVELSDSRMSGSQVMIDFETETSSLNHSIVGGELSDAEPSRGSSHWSGTATLELVGNTWLINRLTIESFGGSTG